MATLIHPQRSQSGHSLAQTLVGMALSMLLVCAAFALLAWLQTSHLQLQAQTDAHSRLNTTLNLLRERVQRGSAPELIFDSKGKAALSPPPIDLEGSDQSLSVPQVRSLTPADCQGHQASSWYWLMDDFMLSTRQQVVCKDSWRDASIYQALVDGVTALQFRYAQVLPGTPLQMQWLRADQVSDWQAVTANATCIQVQTDGATLAAASSPCTPMGKGLAWRGVAVLRHHKP